MFIAEDSHIYFQCNIITLIGLLSLLNPILLDVTQITPYYTEVVIGSSDIWMPFSIYFQKNLQCLAVIFNGLPEGTQCTPCCTEIAVDCGNSWVFITKNSQPNLQRLFTVKNG